MSVSGEVEAMEGSLNMREGKSYGRSSNSVRGGRVAKL